VKIEMTVLYIRHTSPCIRLCSHWTWPWSNSFSQRNSPAWWQLCVDVAGWYNKTITEVMHASRTHWYNRR